MGECAGLDGGASKPTSINIRRKYKQNLNNSKLSVIASGDSADGELSDEGSVDDRTPTSSTKKLHKKSPKKYPFSASKSRKDKSETKTRRNFRLDSSDEAGSNDESGTEEDDNHLRVKSRDGVKQTNNSISKSISNSSKKNHHDTLSSSDSEKDSKEMLSSKKDLSSIMEPKHKSRNSESKDKKKESSKHRSSPQKSKKLTTRSNSVSENSDFIMPELEPQVTNKSLVHPKDPVESPKSQKKSKLGKDEKKSQKSIKAFLSEKRTTVYDNFDSASSQEEGTTSKFEQRLEKVQKHAIEKSYEANKDFLKTFESFQKKDVSLSPKEKEKKAAESKSYTLIASTLHPKKVIKEEMKKEKKREEERKRVEDVVQKKKPLEEEISSKSLKRKEREWEMAKQQEKEAEERHRKEKSEKRRKEKEEKKRQEREEREKLEREKENIRLKEQMLEKKKQWEEEKEKERTEFEKKIPLPISSPKKLGNLQETPKTIPISSKNLKSPEVNTKVANVEKDKKKESS